MANAVKNLSHIIIRKSETVEAFQIGDTVYSTLTKIPAAAIIALTLSPSPVGGMRDYILACIPDPDQKADFINLIGETDIEGLGAIIEAIVEATTPFSGVKPSA